MSCNDVRQGLPLLPGADPEHTARIRAHALACETCGELVRAYEADDRQLSAVKSDRRVPDGVLDGFTASVMARIAEEQRKRVAAPASVAPSSVAASPQAAPAGAVLRPDFGAWRLVAAVAAAVVLAVGIDLSGGLGSGPTPAPLANAVDTTVAPGEGPGVVGAPLPVFTSNPVEALPAPARLERDPAPMPLRRRGGPIVPVDQGGRRGGGRGAAGQQDLLNLIDEVLPNLHQRMLRQLGDQKEGREVRF
jgi:hypothetical protein